MTERRQCPVCSKICLINKDRRLRFHNCNKKSLYVQREREEESQESQVTSTEITNVYAPDPPVLSSQVVIEPVINEASNDNVFPHNPIQVELNMFENNDTDQDILERTVIDTSALMSIDPPPLQSKLVDLNFIEFYHLLWIIPTLTFSLFRKHVSIKSVNVI